MTSTQIMWLVIGIIITGVCIADALINGSNPDIK